MMMPVLLFFYPTSEVLLFVSSVHWINALWRLIIFRTGFNLKLVLSFGLSGIVAAYFGAKSFFIVDEVLIEKIIAVFLFAYAIFLWFNPQFTIKFSFMSGSVAGVLSGFVAGIFGMGGAIRGAFLSAFNLEKSVYLANSALLLMLIDTSRMLTYLKQGLSFDNILGLAWWQFIVSLFLAILGVECGKIIVTKIPQEKFRLGIAIFLLLISIKLYLG